MLSLSASVEHIRRSKETERLLNKATGISDAVYRIAIASHVR